MAYTVAQLTAIENAIGDGSLSVEFAGPGGVQKIVYRSFAELTLARDQIRAELVAAGQIAATPRVSYASFGKD